jgi:hypothetical protein
MVVILAGAERARAGHEFPFYPSFYPQEIRVEVVAPVEAAKSLRSGTLHAYLGPDPFADAPPGGSIASIESLGAYVTVTLNPAAPIFADRASRCRAARAVTEALPREPGTWKRHAYPVTPYHADLLQHADLVDAAGRVSDRGGWAGPPLRVRAGDALAERLVPAGLRPTGGTWDAIVQAVDAADLARPPAASPSRWTAVPGVWARAGWFHAYRLLGDAVSDAAGRREVEAIYRRLLAGGYGSLAERLDLERRLVSRLRQGCERVVAGYTVRREFLNVEYSRGVENVAHDGIFGLNTPAFPRTVKLKDFPWNGWLTVGVSEAPLAAWSPIGGFDDPVGRLIWSAVGDPALFPAPHGASWVPNRVTLAESSETGAAVEVPGDALAPDPETGWLRKVEPGKRAAVRLTYRALASRFHDGTRTTVGDLLYPFVVAYRWGANPARAAHDPWVAEATALLRDRLIAVRVVKVETDTLSFGEERLTYEVPIVEVYLDRRTDERLDMAALAPPWSTLPWHVIALMEEAIARGLRAPSQGGPGTRGLPGIDLVREPRLVATLAALVDDLGRRGHVPPGLAGYASPEEARARWAALRTFQDANKHLLVTNGPYRLAEWSPTATVLRVFRDLTYPRGVGSFDRHAYPLRAFVTKAEIRGEHVEVEAEIERVERFGRDHRVVREPFVKRAVERDKRSLPICHYAVIGPDGRVAAAGSVEAAEPGVFRVPLPPSGAAGDHAVLLALTIDDSRTHLPIRKLTWTR